MAVDNAVSRQEALGLPRRLEPLHLPLAPMRRPVGVLGAVVEVAALPVLDLGHDQAAFPTSSFPTPQLAADAVGTPFFLCPQFNINKVISTQVPFYGYQFDDQTAPFYYPPLPQFQPLAYHTGDLQYLFPHFHGSQGIPRQLNLEQSMLSDELVALWSNFVRTGNPNGIGNLPWPRYDASNPATSYYLSENIPTLSLLKDSTISQQHSCDFFQPFITF